MEVVSLIGAARDYFIRDREARYGVVTPICVTIVGDGVGIGSASCGPLTIMSIKGGDKCILTCAPFDPEDRLWNGPDILPNERNDGSMVASLWHDLIWGFAADIASQTGLSVAEVKQWGNGVLFSVWRSYAQKNGVWTWFNRLLARAAYVVTSWSKKWYGKVKG